MGLRTRIRGEVAWWTEIGERIADLVTERAGRFSAVLLHAVWFTVWIAVGWDHYPYQFLTLCVSLEAIFLTLFVLINQRRTSAAEQEASRKAEAAVQASIQAALSNTSALIDLVGAVKHALAEQDEILDDLHEALPDGDA